MACTNMSESIETEAAKGLPIHTHWPYIVNERYHCKHDDMYTSRTDI